MNIRIFQKKKVECRLINLTILILREMARFLSHLGQFVITVLGRTYSSSYLSLILAYSWSSSVILNTIQIALRVFKRGNFPTLEI